MLMRASLILVSLLLGSAQPLPAPAQPDVRNRAVHLPGEAEEAPPASLSPTLAPLPADSDPSSKANNSAGVRVEAFPAPYVHVGDKIAIRVAVKKAGYLVLVDVDSEGKLSQIYPNTITLLDPKGADPKANFITPESPVTVPSDATKAGFEFVTAPPAGVGMIVAILSETPLQFVDLPDVPASLAGQPGGADFVRANAKKLNIVSNGQIREPKWSIAVAFYGIN